MRGICCRSDPFGSLAALLLLDLLLLCAGIAVAEESESLLQLHRSRDTGFQRLDVFSVDDFGAVGDGLTDDTQAFKDAWRVACSLPFPTVLKVSARSNYLVGPIDFAGQCKSSVTLLVSGTITAPDDPNVWDNSDPHKWLYFHGINHLVVRGKGTINGMGEKWWARSCKIKKTNPCRHAPTAIAFHRCKDLKVKDLKLVDSQQMHMAFTECSGVKVSGLNIFAPAASPNTDGVHISASDSVTVRDSLIMTGDDCISIVSRSSKVRIKDIECGPGHGISIGSLGKSNSWSQVYDVRVNGASISNTENGLRIKTWQGGQGFARNIAFKNILMKNVSNPILIDQYYCDSSRTCPNQTSSVKVDSISFIGIKGTSATEDAMRFSCSDACPCEKVFLKDIQLLLEGGGNTKADCWQVFGSSAGVVLPPPCFPYNGPFPAGEILQPAAELHAIA